MGTSSACKGTDLPSVAQNPKAAVPKAFRAVSDHARSLGLVVWAEQVDLAATEWGKLAEAHPRVHPLHLAIDATVRSCAAGPNAMLLVQWVNAAQRANVEGFYGLPNEPVPAALILPIMPFPAATRALALDLLRLPTAADEPQRQVAARDMILPGEWPTTLVGASRRRAHLILDDFRAVLAASAVTEATTARYADIQKRIPQPRKAAVGLDGILTPEQQAWAKDTARRVAPRAAIAVASIGLAELAGLSAIVKVVSDIVSDVGRLTGDNS